MLSYNKRDKLQECYSYGVKYTPKAAMFFVHILANLSKSKLWNFVFETVES